MPRYDSVRNQFIPATPGSEAGAYLYAASGAITKADGVHAITKTGSLAAMTLAAPDASEEGMRLVIVARTAFAHTVTITAGLGGVGATRDVITFAAVGDSIELLVDNGKWVAVGAPYGATIA